MQNEKFKIVIFLSYYFLFLHFVFSSEAFALLTIKTNNDHIGIGAFYHGSRLNITGEADPYTDIIIKITSPEVSQSLKKKGKVAGLLWMNRGELKLKNIPDVYLLYSTKGFEDILSKDEMDIYSIGYSAVKRQAEITPVSDENEKAKWFNEFIRFKENSKLYDIPRERVSAVMKDGKQEYSIDINWQYQAPPGDYTISAYAVKNNMVSEKTESKLVVEQIGTVRMLANMAKNNGAMYGIVSIVIAIVAGFAVGIIFRMARGGL